MQNGEEKLVLEYDEAAIARFGLNTQTLMLLASIYPLGRVNLASAKAKLEKAEFIVIEGDDIIFTKKGFKIFEMFILDNLNDQMSKKKIKELVEQITNIYPKGKKPETSQYWRGNSKIVEKKLTKFIKDNPNYGADEIIDATKRYISSFDDSTRLMRILPYFIEKDGSSDLLSLLENDSEPTSTYVEELI